MHAEKFLRVFKLLVSSEIILLPLSIVKYSLTACVSPSCISSYWPETDRPSLDNPDSCEAQDDLSSCNASLTTHN